MSVRRLIHQTLATVLTICLLTDASLTNASAIPTPSFERPVPEFSSLVLPKNLISIDFQEADVRDVLRMLSLKSGINIIYGSDVNGPITLHLDQVPFDQVFQTVLTLKGLVALPTGSRVMRIISSTGLSAEQSQAATFTKVYRLNYANAMDIKVPVDAIRGAAGRKGVTSVDAKTNSLIVTDTQEGLNQIEQLLPSLDRKPQQVDIEAKIVEVTLDNSTKTGITWGFARSAEGGNKFGSTTGKDGTVLLGADAQTTSPPASINVPGGSAGGVFGLTVPQAADVANFSFLHAEAAYLLQLQLNALASKDRLRVLSNPHIVTLNNEEANINVVDKIPYTASTTQGQTTTTSVSFIEAGVKLTVKPTVNADRRITLKVKPEVSSPKADTTGGVAPTVNTRNAETTIVLKDGETIAIGGLIREQTQKTVQGIPYLMSIPILGYLFKSSSNRKVRTELIVFVTPKIVAE